MSVCRLRMFRVICIVLIFLVTLTPYPAWAQDADANPPPPDLQAVAAPVPGVLQEQRRITPSGNLKAGQDTTVAIQFSGKTVSGCWGVPGKPVDTVVLLDTSPSAGRPAPGSNLDRSQQILRSLWKQMDQPIYETIDRSSRSRLAIVTIDTGLKTAYEVTTRLALTDTGTAIEAAVAGLQNGADSGFDDGVRQAATLLKDTARPDAARAIILLLHDNFFFDKEDVVVQAVKDAAKQVPVFVIGNWYNVRPIDRVTRDVATGAVGTADRVMINPSAQDLRRLFVLASGSTPNSLGKVLRVQEVLSPLNAVEIRGSDVGNGGILEGNKITWKTNLPLVSAPGEVRYSFRVAAAAAASLSMTAGIDFVDCNGFLQVGVNPFRSSSPIETATTTPAAATSVSTSSSTPVVTLTFTPSRVLTATPTATPVAGIVVFGVNISFWPWSLFCIVPLLLIPLFWIWWKSRQQPKPSLPPPGEATKGKIKHNPDTPSPQLPVGPPQTGEILRPGTAPEDQELRALLSKETVFKGRVQTKTIGYASSPVETRILKSAREMDPPSGWSLGRFGSDPEFLWQHETKERRVPVAELQRILSERIANEGPLLAVWTRDPVDNATIVIKQTSNDDTKEERVRITRVYRLPKGGHQTPPEKCYWLELRLLNRSGWKIDASKPVEIDN